MLAVLPFLMMGVIIYLVITINVLKRAWKKLDAAPSDETTINFAKIMNITFDVKRMLGPANLIAVSYTHLTTPSLAATMLVP